MWYSFASLFLFCAQRWEKESSAWGVDWRGLVIRGLNWRERRKNEGEKRRKERLNQSVTVTCFWRLRCQLVWFGFSFIAFDFCSCTLNFIISIKILPELLLVFYFSAFLWIYFGRFLFVWEFSWGRLEGLHIRFELIPFPSPVHAHYKAAITYSFSSLENLTQNTQHTLLHTSQPSHLSLVQPGLACSTPLDRVRAHHI